MIGELLVGGLLSCAPWEPPGGGVPKGCRASVQFDAPLARGLGLSSHVEWGDDDASAGYRAFEAAEWERLGVGTVRRDLTWSEVEPTPGAFDWDGPDRAIAAIEGAGAAPLGILLYGNPWASESGDEHAPPDDVQDFADYATAAAEHFDGRIRDWEIWNEENVGKELGIGFWYPSEDAAAYADLLATAAGAVHAVDADARVSFGGLFWPKLFNTAGADFLADAFAARPDLASKIDAVAFHPYRYPFTAPEISSYDDDGDLLQEPLADSACTVADILDEAGAPDLAIQVTEVGWHTAPDALAEGVSQDDQAAFLVRGAVLAFAQGAAVVHWYTFRDSGVDSADQEQMFGLYGYDADPTDATDAEPKSSAGAYAALSDALGTHDRIEDWSERLGLDEECYAYRMTGGGAATWTLWRTAGEATLVLPGEGDAAVTSATGGGETVASSRGAWEVAVGPIPVFVQEP